MVFCCFRLDLQHIFLFHIIHNLDDLRIALCDSTDCMVWYFLKPRYIWDDGTVSYS